MHFRASKVKRSLFRVDNARIKRIRWGFLAKCISHSIHGRRNAIAYATAIQSAVFDSLCGETSGYVDCCNFPNRLICVVKVISDWFGEGFDIRLECVLFGSFISDVGFSWVVIYCIVIFIICCIVNGIVRSRMKLLWNSNFFFIACVYF